MVEYEFRCVNEVCERYMIVNDREAPLCFNCGHSTKRIYGPPNIGFKGVGFTRKTASVPSK